MNNRKKLVQILAGIMAAVMLLTLILGLIPTKASALSSKEIKKQINALKEQDKELEKQIEDVQAQYEENEDEILNMVNQKYAIDQEIVLLYDKIDNIGQQISAYGLLIADQQDELDAAVARLEDLSEKNKERIRAMEEDGNVSYWSVLFKANSFSDLLDRLNMIDEIAAADQRRLKEMSEAAELVAEAQALLVSEKDELQQTKDALDATYEQLNQKQAEAQKLLNDLIAKGYELEDLFAQYEQEKLDLQNEIAMKEAEYELQKELEWIAYMATYTEPTTAPPATTKPTTGSDSNDSGKETEGESDKEDTPAETTKPTEAPSASGEKWMVPCSYRQLTSPFGERESPTAGASSNHKGIDLAGSRGTPIKATKSGVVTVRSSSRSAGNYVTIRHDNTYSSIYMHLENSIVSKGQVVSQGQVIGYMGDSGIATGVHLHFGIIKNGSYVNPANYMYFHP
ncbi:MAG: hypothetical protein E7431_06925 [Ruminococcaceae bacterium]|nr:hypothetical protein [Oscillospiraceae bacterium]